MRLEDLPADVQRQVRAGRAVVGAPAGRARRVRPHGAQSGRPPTHRCETCGWSGTYPKVERHVDETHSYGRIGLVL